ncbi:MAG: methyltransferase domain-containing protein [Syntrophales bacterium]|nr:methyltransferase domain-containing protein [Syntrophales bacterium]
MTRINDEHTDSEPAALLRAHIGLFTEASLPGPVLDLACGGGRNGVYLASLGLSVILCDVSEAALSRAASLASSRGVSPRFMRLDLEREGASPLEEDVYGGVIVFRYLHRPLMPLIKKSIRPTGILVYETFTIDQARYGKPTNPDYLLEPGELRRWFSDWEVLYWHEGVEVNPERAVAQIVCRKPGVLLI